MDFSDFRSRAVAEGKRYGKDEYVFVREFAQNARDAGATRISLNAVHHNNELLIVFSDDGVGMSFEHARKYLFTLYASSKEKETQSAGQFGVGFWSILLFSPKRIVIHSRTDSEHWGVEFNHDLDGERRVRSNQQHRGTRVVATKPMDTDAAKKAIDEIEMSLRRYCKYLRRNNRKATPLEVLFNDNRIDAPMTLEGECTATFSYADVQGAVALGKTPKVNLYVRGLPVWLGTSLSELQYGASPEVPISYPRGLAPVYLINGNKLSVTLDRRSVFDDAALQRTRRIAQREMRKLVSNYLDNVAPRTLRSRMEFAFSSFVEDGLLHLLRRLAPVAPVVVVLAAVVGMAWFVFPTQVNSIIDAVFPNDGVPAIGVEHHFGTLATSDKYEQASTQVGTGGTLKLRYRPAQESFYFRTQVVEQLRIHSGAKSGKLSPYRIPADFTCQSECVEIEAALENKIGVYHLPVPTGYYIDVNSLHRNGPLRGKLVRSAKDDWLFVQETEIPKADASISYTAGPATTAIYKKAPFLQLPQITLPTAYEEALEKVAPFKQLKKQVDHLTLFVETAIAYDVSLSTATRYQSFFDQTPPGNWFDFVLQLNKGDCDVKNIILLVMLRRLGIVSRLAVGYVGENGKTKAGKHAWIEYYDNGWKIADSTGQETTPITATNKNAANELNPLHPPVPTQDEPAANPQQLPPPISPMNDSSSPTPSASSWKKIPYSFWAMGISALGVLLLALLVTWRIVRHRGCAKGTTPSTKQEKLVAQMLQAAVEDKKLHPSGSGLYSRALIPTWNGNCRISMNRAWELAKKRTLFYSSTDDELTKRLVAGANTVVNISNGAFTAIVSRIPGSVSIDEIVSLRPVQITADNKNDTIAHQVLHAANTIGRDLGLDPNFIVPCRGLKGSLFKEMDISPLPTGWKQNIPPQFVAVSVDHHSTGTDIWPQLVTLGGGVPGAALLLLDRLAVHCAVLEPNKNALRAALAKQERGDFS